VGHCPRGVVLVSESALLKGGKGKKEDNSMDQLILSRASLSAIRKIIVQISWGPKK
jgi:hypothetical protein